MVKIKIEKIWDSSKKIIPVKILTRNPFKLAKNGNPYRKYILK